MVITSPVTQPNITQPIRSMAISHALLCFSPVTITIINAARAGRKFEFKFKNIPVIIVNVNAVQINNKLG